jgi:hypothetical protein
MTRLRVLIGDASKITGELSNFAWRCVLGGLEDGDDAVTHRPPSLAVAAAGGLGDLIEPCLARQTLGKSRSTPASTSEVAISRQERPSARRRRTFSRIRRRWAAY